MVINGKEVSEWMDFLNFQENKITLNTYLVDQFICHSGGDFDGNYASLIAGPPGNQFVNVDRLNEYAAAAGKKAQGQYNRAYMAHAEIQMKIDRIRYDSVADYPYPRRVIGIRKLPIVYRTENGGLNSMLVMKTMFTVEEAKQIYGWSEYYQVQTIEHTAGKSGDFFDYGKSRVVGTSNEVQRHGGITEDAEYYYLRIHSEEQRQAVIKTIGPEYGIYVHPACLVHEGYANAVNTFISQSMLYTIANGRPIPPKAEYTLSIAPEVVRSLRADRGTRELKRDNHESTIAFLQLFSAMIMMFPITALVKAINLADKLSGKMSWLRNYLLGIFPGLFHGKIWPPSKLFTYGQKMCDPEAGTDPWILAFWLALPICLAFAASFIAWREKAHSVGAAISNLLLQIVMFLVILIAYPLAIPILLSLSCYTLSHRILLGFFTKRDINRRKKELAKQAYNHRMGGM